MRLDVWIYGSGYGESMLLIWDAPADEGPTKRRAAFIDAYGDKDMDSHPALRRWRDEGCPHVALACVTHPHLDHVQNAAVMMRAAGCTADCVLWWGGHELQRSRAFYAKLSADATLKGQELGKTARMTWDFLNEVYAVQEGTHKCRPAGPNAHVKAPMQNNLAHSDGMAGGQIYFYAISPWLEPQTAYTKWIDSQISSVPADPINARPGKGVANCTSLGFLIQYGNAQVLLGGDMEEGNWGCFHAARASGGNATVLPPLAPCLIKASHHGSPTGQVPGMWKAGAGFFGSLACVGGTPYCVITPWRMGASEWHLPRQEVIDGMTKARYHVWVTGNGSNGSSLDRTTRIVNSSIHFVVDSTDNRVTKVEDHFCRYFAP
jgi:hypothetical protein